MTRLRAAIIVLLIPLATRWRHFKGRVWCLRFHAPVLRGLGGYGGTDHRGRRRKGYHSMSCSACGNNWEQADRGERQFGALMWHTRDVERRAEARRHER